MSLVHGTTLPRGALVGAADFDKSELAELQTRVEVLKLQRRERELSESAVSAGKPAPVQDVSETAGIGALTDNVKTKLQSRAFNLESSPTESGWFMKLLSSPESMKIAAGALRGALGIETNHQSALGSLAQELGLNSLDLLKRLIGDDRRSPSGFVFEGMNLAGLQPEVIVALDRKSVV
jgi:hypothetical protein